MMSDKEADDLIRLSNLIHEEWRQLRAKLKKDHDAVYVRFSGSTMPGDPESIVIGPFPAKMDAEAWPVWWVSPAGNFCFMHTYMHEDGSVARELLAFKKMELIR